MWNVRPDPVNRPREQFAKWPVRQPFNPSACIYESCIYGGYFKVLSCLSRYSEESLYSFDDSIPLAFLIERDGINSIMFPQATSVNCWPACKCRSSRKALGMDNWNLLESLARNIILPFVYRYDNCKIYGVDLQGSDSFHIGSGLLFIKRLSNNLRFMRSLWMFLIKQ